MNLNNMITDKASSFKKQLLMTTLLSIFTLPLSSHAELIFTTTHADGKTTMNVFDDKQEDLPPPQLGIAPANISDTLTLSTGKLDKSITLYNYGSTDKSIPLSLIDLDANGQPIAPSETTLRPWTLINPTQFTIPANGQQTVRMSIRPPMEFAKGSYKGLLMIEQKVDNAVSYDEYGKGVTLKLGSRYGLPLAISVE